LNKIYSFDEQIELQEQCYSLLKTWLSLNPNIIRVWDSEFDDDWHNGIDCYIETNKNKIYAIQVKVDFWIDRTNNLPFETISQAYSDRPSVIGAEFNYPKVDYIFYIFAESKKVLGYKFKPLLEYVINNYREYKNFKANNKTYKTLGCLVPVDSVKHLVTHSGYIIT